MKTNYLYEVGAQRNQYPISSMETQKALTGRAHIPNWFSSQVRECRLIKINIHPIDYLRRYGVTHREKPSDPRSFQEN